MKTAHAACRLRRNKIRDCNTMQHIVARWGCLVLAAVFACATLEAGAVALRKQVVDVARYPLAVCSDGTPAAFYMSPPPAAGIDEAFSSPSKSNNTSTATSWVVFFSGGGACTDESHCLDRAFYFPLQTTSKVTADHKVSVDVKYRVLPNDFQSGTLLSDAAVTEGAGVILLPYCTGDMHIGNRSFALTNTTSGFPINQWHFRGAEIVRAVLQTAMGAESSNIASVLLAGTSAGAIGAASHVETLSSMYPTANVKLLLDSWPAVPFGYGSMEGGREFAQGFRHWFGGELQGSLAKNDERRFDHSLTWPCYTDAVCMLNKVVPPEVPVFYLQAQQDLYSVLSVGLPHVVAATKTGDPKFPALAAYGAFEEFFSHSRVNNNRFSSSRKGFVTYAPACMLHGTPPFTSQDLGSSTRCFFFYEVLGWVVSVAR